MPRLKTMTVKVSDLLVTKVARLAKKRGRTQSDIVREALEAFAGSERPSFAEAAARFAGAAKGPGDLSTNPRYFEDFGR